MAARQQTRSPGTGKDKKQIQDDGRPISGEMPHDLKDESKERHTEIAVEHGNKMRDEQERTQKKD